MHRERAEAVPDNFLTIGGVIVPAASLVLPRARALAEAASSKKLPYVELVECRSATREQVSIETVVMDLAVERPQRPANDIQYTERIAVEFESQDRSPPEVLALRGDFPWVPHINLRINELPRSLCLYEESWAEISPRWTAAAFIERIRYWLAATARGELHQEDQPLEPLLFGSGLRGILPAGIYSELGAAEPLRLEFVWASGLDGCRTLVAKRVVDDGKAKAGSQYVGTTFLAKPQTHGLIRRTPQNLADLHAFLAAGEIDLVGSLRERLRQWSDEPALLKSRLAIIVGFAVARKEGAEAEKWEVWAFNTIATVREIGAEIGLWDVRDESVGLLIGADETKRGEAVPVHVISPTLAFSPSSAAAANGVPADTSRVVAVGAGALGSQVITSLYRTGFGDWTIVDEDDLMPHNLARHELTDTYVGLPKSLSLAHHLNLIYPDHANGICADVLDPGDEAEALAASFAAADVILDLSASAIVAQHIAADVKSPGRRISAFLNPQGTDAVVITEDKGRTLTLDVLEAQYYRAANCDPALEGHLLQNTSRLRYGRSCRDISTTMSTQTVSMLSAITSQAIKIAIESDDASIQVCRCNPTTLAVTPVSVAVERCVRQQFCDWMLVLDERLLGKLAELRAEKLPNETGGVLIGLYELDRKTIHVVETIPSPPDSAEWPNLYIRGSEGLLKSVEVLAARTGGQLAYVGEWHSHPDRCATRPSGDDLQVFGWLTDHMSTDGRPALMAIVGERGISSWYLGEMKKSGGWEVKQ